MNHPSDLRQQIIGHVHSLRNAGIDMLPRGAGSLERMRDLLLRSPAPEVMHDSDAGEASGVAATGLEASLENKTASEGNMPSTSKAGDLAGRLQALDLLAKEVSGCTKCAGLCSTRTQTVFADGSPEVELCFVGEAPGADEDAQGKPFVGAAGQLLNRIIAAMGLTREEVYICNIIKCRPPGNRTPLPDEANNCKDFLHRQLGLVKPKFICALGGCAATNLLGVNTPLGKLRGTFHDFNGIPVIATYHPAYLLPHRNPGAKKLVWEDMQMLLKRMGREVPDSSAKS